MPPVWLQPAHFGEDREPENYPKSVHQGVHISLYDFESEKYCIADDWFDTSQPCRKPRVLASDQQEIMAFLPPKGSSSCNKIFWRGEFWTCAWMGFSCHLLLSETEGREHRIFSTSLITFSFQAWPKDCPSHCRMMVHQSSLRLTWKALWENNDLRYKEILD